MTAEPADQPLEPATPGSSAFIGALMLGIRGELDRVFWNVNQRYWRREECGCPSEPLGIEGMEWEQPSEWDDANCSGAFTSDGVTVSWYKHFGRGLTAKSMTPTEWAGWFDRIFDSCDLFQERHYEIAEADANQPESADSKCPVCGRWFAYPARRCGYDATVLDEGLVRVLAERNRNGR